MTALVPVAVGAGVVQLSPESYASMIVGEECTPFLITLSSPQCGHYSVFEPHCEAFV